MLRNILAILLVAGVAAGIAVGCGGSDESSSGSTTISSTTAGTTGASSAPEAPIPTSSLSKAEYVKRANAFCARNAKERIAEANAYIKANQGSEDAVAGLIAQVYMPRMEAMIGGLRKLGAPPDGKDTVEALIVAIEKRVAAVANRDEAKSTSVTLEGVKRAEHQASRYGLKACHG